MPCHVHGSYLSPPGPNILRNFNPGRDGIIQTTKTSNMNLCCIIAAIFGHKITKKNWDEMSKNITNMRYDHVLYVHGPGKTD